MLLLAAGLLVGFAALNAWAADDAPAKETGTVIGKVIDSDNNPVSSAVIDVLAAKASHPTTSAAGGDAPKSPAPRIHGRTGQDGTFKFENVPVGKYIVNAHREGKGGGHTKEPLEVKANETVDAGTITLQMRPGSHATTVPSK